ncbi:hypothetical protein [Streptomyces sp. NPDC048527]|uniref:hypothetical protein n=1 Tax=Streptomyces sp. NPDC048527 TaxID=3365568 RepID=UPI0037155DEA
MAPITSRSWSARAAVVTLTATGDVGDDFDNITSSLTVSSPDKEAIVKVGDAYKGGGGGTITIKHNDVDVDAKSLLRLARSSLRSTSRSWSSASPW